MLERSIRYYRELDFLLTYLTLPVAGRVELNLSELELSQR